MKLERGTPATAGAGPATCPFHALCGKRRLLDACDRCRHGPGASSAGASRARAVQLDGRAAAGPIAALGAEPQRLAWRVHHDLPLRTRYRLVAPVARVSAPAVEDAARAVAGVRSARFTPGTGSLLVEHDGSAETRRALQRALEGLSAGDVAARPGEARGDAGAAERDGLVKAALVSLLTAALPPAPVAAFRLVRSLAAAAER